MQTIAPLPSDQAERVLAQFDAGTRIIVLVEGEDDRDTLREWFNPRPELEFFDCGGIMQLKRLLAELLASSTLKRVFAISDRDFHTEAEVAASYADGSHLFILPRYALENYLLEPQPLWQIFKIQDPGKFVDEQAVSQRLLELCRKLKSVMAVNWVIWEEYCNALANSGEREWPEYLSKGFEPGRPVVLKEAALRLRKAETEVDIQLSAKEGLIEQQFSELSKPYGH
jgi:hypothetical protein